MSWSTKVIVLLLPTVTVKLAGAKFFPVPAPCGMVIVAPLLPEVVALPPEVVEVVLVVRRPVIDMELVLVVVSPRLEVVVVLVGQPLDEELVSSPTMVEFVDDVVSRVPVLLVPVERDPELLLVDVTPSPALLEVVERVLAVEAVPLLVPLPEEVPRPVLEVFVPRPIDDPVDEVFRPIPVMEVELLHEVEFVVKRPVLLVESPVVVDMPVVEEEVVCDANAVAA